MALKEIKKDSVAFLMPCGGDVPPRVVQSALNLITTSAVQGITVRQIGITDRTLVHTARNYLAAGFLDTECEWAFWMDSDMILQPDTIVRMLGWAKRLDAKMLTGIYYQRMGDHKPVVWRKKVVSTDGNIVHEGVDEYSHYYVYPKEVGGPPYKVDTAGFGCVLIHRSVFDDVEYPYFRFVFYKDREGKPCEASEDFYFFVQAKKAGHQLWAVPELDCGHVAPGKIIRHADMKIDLDKMTEMKIDYEKEAVR